jgi:hypothetical protein
MRGWLGLGLAAWSGGEAARDTRARGVVACSSAAHWWLAGGKGLPVSSWGPQGQCWARWSGVELTRAVTRLGGGGGCFGRRRSSTGRELRWPIVMEARPYSVGAEEGR